MALNELPALSPDAVASAFEKLRLGFKLSIITIVLFMTSFLFGGFGFLGVAVIAVYLLDVYQRASGWTLLGFKETRTVMLVCAVFLAVYPFFLLFAGFGYWGFFNALTTTGAVFELPIIPWALYTYVESRSAKELERKLNMDFKSARMLPLIGIVAIFAASAVGFAFQLYALYYPFVSGLFASPFLIASCMLFIRKLRLPSESSSKSARNLDDAEKSQSPIEPFEDSADC
jgi:hypothetical protein